MPKISNIVAGPRPSSSGGLAPKARNPPIFCVAAPPVGYGAPRLTHPTTRWRGSAAHQRAASVLERTERLVRRNGGAQVIEVARMLRLGGLFHLEQIGRVNDAAVGT